jgi:hypothetical protein
LVMDVLRLETMIVHLPLYTTYGSLQGDRHFHVSSSLALSLVSLTANLSFPPSAVSRVKRLI